MTLETWKDVATSLLEDAIEDLAVETYEYEEHKLTKMEEKALDSYIKNAIKSIESAREYVYIKNENDWEV